MKQRYCDDEVDEFKRRRAFSEAFDTLQAHEEAIARRPQPCHQCDTPHDSPACPKCNAERPAFTALKNITRQQQAEKNAAEAAEDYDVARIARHCGAA